MARSIATFLMFQGAAEEAMRLYLSLFPGSAVKLLERWAPGEPGPEGAFKRAEVTIAGHELVFFDSPTAHAFGFTPSVSLFVECVDDAEFARLFDALSAGGELLMPPDDYGFSRRFTWLNDRWGVSWQLNLA